MNLLYISNISGNMWSGPNNSVPAQISAQSKIDNVFWYNLNYISKKEWRDTGFYFNLKDYPKKSLFDLPYPFSNPDLIIFEGVYNYPFSRIAYEANRLNIPYILIPRSQLTSKAKKNKKTKKMISDLVYFNRFINNASAIQYLTQEEYEDSQHTWNNSHLIIPNGIDKKEQNKTNFNIDKLRGAYIGRIELYQKGLDMLLEACNLIQTEMRQNNCTIDLYGPNRDGTKEKLMHMIKKYKLNDLITINEGVFDKEKEQTQINSDFFIMTSRFEGHPMGLIEALSYGLPAVVTTGTYMEDDIVNSNAGWSAGTSVESIKKAILQLISERELLYDKSKNALELSKKYSWDKIAEYTQKKYTRIIQKDY